MSNWISVEDALPEEGPFFLVLVRTIRDGLDGHGSRHRVMRITKGMIAEQRKAYKVEMGFSRPYGNADQHENNLVPYKWMDAGGCGSFGQEVTHWQPLPDAPQ